MKRTCKMFYTVWLANLYNTLTVVYSNIYVVKLLYGVYEKHALTFLKDLSINMR